MMTFLWMFCATAGELVGPFDPAPATYALVPNGSMEQVTGGDLTLWAAGDGLGPTTHAFAGNVAAGIADPTFTNTGAGVSLRQTLTVSPWTDYVVSGFILNTSVRGTASLDLNDAGFVEDDGSVGDCQSVGHPAITEWQFVWCGFSSGAATELTVRLVVDGTWYAGEVAAFDEVALSSAALFEPPAALDADGDGFWFDVDCDDADPDVNPDADEVWYDGVDQNCDGASDFDQDLDGWDDSDDCDDTDAAVHPDAPELCNGLDDDCSGQPDDDPSCETGTPLDTAEGSTADTGEDTTTDTGTPPDDPEATETPSTVDSGLVATQAPGADFTPLSGCGCAQQAEGSTALRWRWLGRRRR